MRCILSSLFPLSFVFVFSKRYNTCGLRIVDALLVPFVESVVRRSGGRIRVAGGNYPSSTYKVALLRNATDTIFEHHDRFKQKREFGPDSNSVDARVIMTVSRDVGSAHPLTTEQIVENDADCTRVVHEAMPASVVWNHFESNVDEKHGAGVAASAFQVVLMLLLGLGWGFSFVFCFLFGAVVSVGVALSYLRSLEIGARFSVLLMITLVACFTPNLYTGLNREFVSKTWAFLPTHLAIVSKNCHIDFRPSYLGLVSVEVSLWNFKG